MGIVINVQDLVKNYGNVAVIKRISFSVNRGEIFALLGTNGAGKTTTLECIEGLRKYQSGSIDVDGKIGVQLQSSALPANIKAIEAVELFSRWNKVAVDKNYLARLGIMEFSNKQYRELSTGQKRRLHLAISMIGNPDIVVLDEPTAGLDVEGRVSLHEEIRQMRDSGKTIIMASHDMAEVEQLCDRIAILKDGNIAFIGTAEELVTNNQVTNTVQVRFSSDPVIGDLKHCVYIDKQLEHHVFEIENLAIGLIELSNIAINQNITIRDIGSKNDSLEERFINIAREGK